MTQQYELAVVYDPGLEVDLSKAEERVKKVITDNGGKIEQVENWGKRKLAYSINKNDHGIYVFYRVDIEPVAVQKIEKSLNIVSEVIRYLVVRQDEKELVKAEAAKQAKAEREADKDNEVDSDDKDEEES